MARIAPDALTEIRASLAYLGESPREIDLLRRKVPLLLGLA